MQIDLNEELPMKMCQHCLFLLKNSIRFKLKCENSDKHLRNLINNYNISNKDFKETFVQYILFTQNFPNEIKRKIKEKEKNVIQNNIESKNDIIINNDEMSNDMMNSNDDDNDDEQNKQIDDDDEIDRLLNLMEHLTGNTSEFINGDIKDNLSTSIDKLESKGFVFCVLI